MRRSSLPTTQRVSAQKSFAKRLNDLGLLVELEKEVGHRVVDIFLPDAITAIEIDGPHHSRKRDKQRDDELLALGVSRIIHFNYASLRMSLEELCKILCNESERVQYVYY